MKPTSQDVLELLDRLIAEAEPADLPALAMALSARVSVATARLLEVPTAPQSAARNRHLLTVAEAAARLKIRKARAYELIRQGHLPCIRVGVNQIRVSEAALAKWLARTKAVGPCLHPVDGGYVWPVVADG